MVQFDELAKLEEFFDTSKAVLFIPVLFSFCQILIDVSRMVDHFLAKKVRESAAFKIIEELSDNCYKFCFVAIFGLMTFGMYASGAIVVYITLAFYVAFYSLPLIHKNEQFKKGIMEFVLFLLICVLLLILLLDVSFN